MSGPTFPAYRNFVSTFDDAPGEKIVKVDATAPVNWWLSKNETFTYEDVLDRYPPALQPPYPLVWLESEAIRGATTRGFGMLAYCEDLHASGTDRGQINARWSYALKLFRQSGRPAIDVDDADIELLVTPTGEVERFASSWIGEAILDPDRERDAVGTIVISAALMSAISFMNCRGVEVVERTAFHGRAGRRGAFRISYKTLDIEPMRRRLDGAGAGEPGVSAAKAFHLCRGHIKTYTEDAPLFGKYVGAVWCPPHARGNPEHGVVAKDYRVKGRSDE